MERLAALFGKQKRPTDFSAIRISIASPEKIREWSHGEVKKPETINYRTFKPERDGLFCAKIFGPLRDYECNCRKYTRMKHRGVTCEMCGIEVISSKVRRERLGHIELATPVAHIWFMRSLPSRIGTILDMTLKELERVIYYESYIVIDPKDTPLQKKQLLSDEDYYEAIFKYTIDNKLAASVKKLLKKPNLTNEEREKATTIVKQNAAFKAGMGAEAIKKLLEKINLEELSNEIREELRHTRSKERKEKLAKRLRVVEAFRLSGQRPEWMILDIIPVLPPDLRPLVPLDGGRFATSDLNDFYRRVINRNNRLKRLMELNAREIIIRNEKRMLQEAVDALFDNARRGRIITGQNKRPLKSLSDMIKGKGGRFRQNLLGKRVDYSGRSVIVPDPMLKLNQCGLPKLMALELFKPFIYQKLEERGYATTIKAAKKMVEREKPEVWDVLDKVIREHPILLNRQPTLHRMGIQAFEPVLHDDKAIKLHPLVCKSFNADFDGDTMVVHVPLSIEAQTEARVLMMSENNILSPTNGTLTIKPIHEIVLGMYYLTKEKRGTKGEGNVFSGQEEVMVAYNSGYLSEHVAIKVKMDGKMIETTTGRLLLKEVLPERVPFPLINRAMTEENIEKLILYAHSKMGNKKTAEFLDKLMNIGFEYISRSGLSICIDDIKIPSCKDAVIEGAVQGIKELQNGFEHENPNGYEFFKRMDIIWNKVSESIKTEVDTIFKKEDTTSNIISMMLASGIRTNLMDKIYQLAGIRGFARDSNNNRFRYPVLSNYREGLSPIEYFMTTFSAGKVVGNILSTSKAGHLFRKLIYAVQDMVVTEDDCGTGDGIEVELDYGIVGRISAEETRNPVTGEIIAYCGMEITDNVVNRLKEWGGEKIKIRSPVTCHSGTGICAKCYGIDISTGKLVEVGMSAGIIAAQSIGAITSQHIFDAWKKEWNPAVWLNKIIGLFEFRESTEKTVIEDTDNQSIDDMDSPPLFGIMEDVDNNKADEKDTNPTGIDSETKSEGRDDNSETITDGLDKSSSTMQDYEKQSIDSKDSISLHELLKSKGIRSCQLFLIKKLQELYNAEGLSTDCKHFEIIIKMMTDKMVIEDLGDTKFLRGELISRKTLLDENALVSIKEGGMPAIASSIINGISKAALNNNSFIAASAFQETTKVLTNAAISGKIDFLRGLTENIISGRLIPAGTGFRK
ncbi:MAG: DNA-directed RNA polymerase subunit beta' [Deltaproteobacteria bacterium]|nr:DNA-directed RNA polymerase subunit beta' [Deltaproteobacteria bacterium]